MRAISCFFSIFSFIAVVNVAWLHSAARLGLQEGASEWVRFVWGVSVPYFFASAIFWQCVRVEKFEKLSREILRLVKRLLVPYFIWCVLGSMWSIALHGVQLDGWEALRYVGLHPFRDPAYQPLWFLRNLFVLLLIETIVKSFYLRIEKKAEYRDDKVCRPEVGIAIRRLVFPIYIIHSFFLSILSHIGFVAPAIVYALIVVGCSAGVAIAFKRIFPKMYSIMFGGR